MPNALSDTQNIEKVIALADQWTLLDDGSWNALTEVTVDWQENQSITDAQLATCHEKLPLAMRAILEFRKKYENPLVAYKDEIRDTLSLLRGDLLTVTSDHRRTVFKTIHTLQFVESAPDIAILMGTSCSTWKCQSLCESIMIVTNSWFNSISFTRDELDTQLPGWSNRLETGQALGIEGAQLYQYVFFAKRMPSAHIDFDGLNFD